MFYLSTKSGIIEEASFVPAIMVVLQSTEVSRKKRDKEKQETISRLVFASKK